MLWLQLALLVLVVIVQGASGDDASTVTGCDKVCGPKRVGECVKAKEVCKGKKIKTDCAGGVACCCTRGRKRKDGNLQKKAGQNGGSKKQGMSKKKIQKKKLEKDDKSEKNGGNSEKGKKKKKSKGKNGPVKNKKSMKRKNNGKDNKGDKKKKKQKKKPNSQRKNKPNGQKACDIKCANDECVDKERKCDKVNDCGNNDDTDERGCKFVPKLTCHRCKTWDTGDTGAIYDPDCGKADYSNHVDNADDADPYIGCAIKVYKNGDVVRLFESWQTNATMGQCYEGTDYKNGGLEYQYTRCWCSSSNCNTNLCEDCSKK